MFLATDGKGIALPQREPRCHPPGREAQQHIAGRARKHQTLRLWHFRPTCGLQGEYT